MSLYTGAASEATTQYENIDNDEERSEAKGSPQPLLPPKTEPEKYRLLLVV